MSQRKPKKKREPQKPRTWMRWAVLCANDDPLKIFDKGRTPRFIESCGWPKGSAFRVRITEVETP